MAESIGQKAKGELKMKKVITFAGLCALLVVVAIGAQAQKVKDIAVGEGAAKYSFANGIELIRLKHTDDYHRNYLIRAPRQKVWSYTQAITWFLNDRGYGMILFPDPRVKGAWKKHVELLIQRQPSEYWATQEKNKPEVFVKLIKAVSIKLNTLKIRKQLANFCFFN